MRLVVERELVEATEEARAALYDIWRQAERMHRASSNKVYLVTDLEIIAEKSRKMHERLSVILDRATLVEVRSDNG